MLCAPGQAQVQAPAPPANPPVVVSGQLAQAQAGPVVLTVEMLEKLPQLSFSTRAPWTRGAQTYTGPLLRDVLALLSARGTTIHATALNDYAITIPVEDARLHDVILAHRINGKPIPVRDRGPMLVMYPFDDHPQLQTQRYYERSIWQIKSLSLQ